jgi:ABC-type glycerol-3-phosphate transport system substrate-binding protein
MVETPRPSGGRRRVLRYSGAGRLFAVLLAVLAIGAAGCGSSKKSTTSNSTAKPTATTKTTYHAGEFCSVKKATVYKAQGLKCVKVKGNYRLEK